MKKTIVTTIFILMAVFANAQITVNPGVRGGLNISDFTNTPNNDSRTDFYIGGFASIDFTHFYNLQPEINYSRQGSKSVQGADKELQYVSMTIANKFYPVRDGGFNLSTGPSFAIKVGDNFNSFDDTLMEVDFLLFGGIGYDFPFGLGIEARYNFGFVDIFGNFEFDEDDNDFEFEDLTLNKFFQVGLTYTFQSKKNSDK